MMPHTLMSIARQHVYDIYDGCSVAMYLHCATLRLPDDYDDCSVAMYLHAFATLKPYDDYDDCRLQTAMHSHALYSAAILQEITNERSIFGPSNSPGDTGQSRILDTV